MRCLSSFVAPITDKLFAADNVPIRGLHYQETHTEYGGKFASQGVNSPSWQWRSFRYGDSIRIIAPC